MSSLTLKSVVWYCQRYTKRFYVQPDDLLDPPRFLNRYPTPCLKMTSPSLQPGTRYRSSRLAFAKWFSDKREIADIPRLEQMCLSGGMERQLPGD